MAETNDDTTATIDAPPIIDFELLTRTVTVKMEGESITLEDHLNNKITEAVAAARYHNKESSVTLVLKFKPGSGFQMDVFPDVTSKVPAEKPTPIPMFADNDGALFVDDPAQRPLKDTAKFRTVHRPKK